MENQIKLKKDYAVIKYSKSLLENYNPIIVFESNNIDDCVNYDCQETFTEGYAVVQKIKDKIYNYYTGQKLTMKTYN